MNAATIIRAAQSEGLKLTRTVDGTVKCIGPKHVTARWAPQLRQHKAEILAALTAANDTELPIDEADDFWDKLRARIDECDALIHELCDIRGDDRERRADLLTVRKRMAPNNLAGDIAYLKAAIAHEDHAPRITAAKSRQKGTSS